MKKSTRIRLLIGGIVFTLTVLIIFEIKKASITDKEIFTDIHLSNVWGGGSGLGSKVENARPFLAYLQKFINSTEIKSIVDIGCGDWELMREIKIPEHIQYLGLDIVDHIIAQNQSKYTRHNVKFKSVDSLEELSSYTGDLLILKDVMQHWSKEKIFYAIDKIIPNFKYAILVNDIELEKVDGLDSRTGYNRILDLESAPFSMKLRLIMDYDVPPTDKKRIYLYVKADQN